MQTFGNSLATTGFETGVRSLPVPAPLLGSLLAEIDDMAELKCTLRFLWHAAQVKGAPKAVPAATMEADAVLASALGSADEVRRGLRLACSRGTLLQAAGRYLLNTPQNRRSAARLAPPEMAAMPREPVVAERSNVFALYEANVGMLTPIVAEQLREAEDTYPAEWIEGAIREAAERNARSWRYIATILERWATGGRGPGGREQRGHGESGRHPEALTAADLLRRRRLSG